MIPRKAYVAVLRYQLGDSSPYIYKTENYGRRWELLTDGSNGIPADFPTRVVREDPVRAGLLFAGTEFGMFVSLDDGENWHTFQQNLGVTPVTDIRVIRGDLAISTMGRSFWVLDSIHTLRQPEFDGVGESAIVFEPKETIRYRNVYSGQSRSNVPDYPPPGVVIDYFLPENLETPVTLQINDAGGTLVNAYESVAADDEADESGADEVVEDMSESRTQVIADQSMSSDPGMNRFRWDMTHQGAWSDDDEKRFRDGPLARPGTYTVRLSAGASVSETSFELVVDPRVLEQGTSPADIDAQVEFELRAIDLLSAIRKLEKSVADEQTDLEKRRDELTEAEELRLIEVTDILGEIKSADIIYPQPMLSSQASYLYNMVKSADQAPGRDAEDRFRELTERLRELRASFRSGD